MSDKIVFAIEAKNSKKKLDLFILQLQKKIVSNPFHFQCAQVAGGASDTCHAFHTRLARQACVCLRLPVQRQTARISAHA